MIAQLYAIPQSYINMFKSIYINSSCCVKTEASSTEFLSIGTGVLQGCIMSSLLFIPVLDFVMRKAMRKNDFGIFWTNQTRVMDHDFADDVALLANAKTVLQEAISKLEKASKKVGLKISSLKTKVM